MRTFLLLIAVSAVVNDAAQPKTSPPLPQPPSAQHQATNGQEHGKQKERQNADHSNGVAGKNQQQKSEHGATGAQVANKQQSHTNSAPTPIQQFRALRAFRAWFVTALAGVGLTNWIAIFTAVVALTGVYVTTLYFLATVGIWFAMLGANRHAERTYKDGQQSAASDRAVMQAQLNEMQATANATYAIAESASISSGAVVGQCEILNTQTKVLMQSLEVAILNAGITKRQLEAYDRPWVAVAFQPHTYLKGEEGGPWVTPWLMLTNTGRSVATDVRYKCRMLPELGGSYRESASDVIQSSGQAIFPGESSRNLIYLAAPDDLMPFAGITVEGDDRYVRLLIEGEVTYRYATSESAHTTKFAYHVGRYEKDKARIVVKIGETIPPDEITFLREPLATYAD